ncbi:Protein lunapark [Sciurus carolinensis]|uniref:Endoplasmic reticulum junction formation protein lunapark n=1 Tax=Sciurus carolinensis TaxID=30640 RepID=A0AA41N7M3_SCICA|nr:Protein lunapark [Sciurus carolinensis]
MKTTFTDIHRIFDIDYLINACHEFNQIFKCEVEEPGPKKAPNDSDCLADPERSQNRGLKQGAPGAEKDRPAGRYGFPDKHYSVLGQRKRNIGFWSYSTPRPPGHLRFRLFEEMEAKGAYIYQVKPGNVKVLGEALDSPDFGRGRTWRFSQPTGWLEEVMEKETYKTAKLILERFDPDSKKAKEFEPPSAGAAVTARPGQEIRQRTAVQRNLSPTPATSNQGPPPQVPVSPGPSKDTSAPGGPPEKTGTPTLSSNVLPRRLGSPVTSVPGMGLHPPGPPLARPILPRERGALDRIVEYLVGDGPQNRYALICQQCFSHNGMALKEEFEYIAFRCAYCFFLNPARKTRPQAPRLPEFSFEKRQGVESSTSLGPLPSGSMLSSENQLSEEPLGEQDVLDNNTEQTDDKISAIEQTDQVIENASGSEEPEEKEETENEETSINEAKSTVTRADSISNLELSEESLITK